MRTSFKHHQLRQMKQYFTINHNPDSKDLRGLSAKTGLSKRVLQVSTKLQDSLRVARSSLVGVRESLWQTDRRLTSQ